jgi:hypothetical protein
MDTKNYDTKNYDVNNNDNFNFNISENSNIFILKYFIAINEYINLYIDNIYDNISINVKKNYRYYIFIKGLELLSNIIHILLIHTNNLDLVIYYCHKAYYYYIEFISQLDYDNNHLELSVKDGIIFVYKKTIFDLKENLNNINNSNINEDNVKKIDNIEKIINIINIFVKIFVIKDILNLNLQRNNKDLSVNICILKILNKISKFYNNEYEFYIYLSKIEEMLNNILKIINKINIISDDNYNINNYINFDLLIVLIDKIIYKLYQTNIDQICKIDFNLIITLELLENLNNTRIKETINKLNI